MISESRLHHHSLEPSEATQAVQDVAILAFIAYGMRDDTFFGDQIGLAKKVWRVKARTGATEGQQAQRTQEARNGGN